ncbi:MAG: LamG domain-containing protein, partial [Kribbellaceae bacterium]|nr:LamG domain-containing protein [Kribbellaceae bacterium]
MRTNRGLCTNRRSGRRLIAAVAAVVSAAAGVTAPHAAASTVATSAERSTARLATLTEAPDAATALAAAHLQHRTVPIAALTTPTRRVSAKPDGTMQAELSPVPAWVQKDDGWVNADPSLRLADHVVTPAATQLPMRLSGGGSAPMATIGSPGRSFALSWPGILPEPVLDGAKSTYPEVLPGVDLVLIADVGQLSQHLVVKTAAAARNPALRSIRLGLHLDGLTVRGTASGALQAVDRTGAVVFEAPPSTMWDAKGRAAKVGVAVDSGTVTLKPDRALLTDPHAAFPITVDPAWRTPDWEWAKVFSGKGNTSYWWGGLDTEPDTGANWGKVGYCGFAGCNNIGTARTYFQFDTSFMNGKTLISAVFSAAIAYSPDCTHTPLHELWIANNVINGGLTWNNQPGGTRIGSAVAGNEYPGCANGYQSIAFNVGDYYSPTNRSVYSIRAANEGDANAWRKYDVSKTRLRFDYNSTPNTPTGMRTDPVLPAPCKWCGGIPYVADASVRLIGTLSDPDNDPLNPDWDVFSKQPSSTDIDGDVVDERGPALASGATFSRTLDLTKLDGRQLWWKLRGWDGSAGGPRVTADKSFVVDRTPSVTQPGVTGDLYTTDDNSWHGGVGVPGKFTFTPFGGSGTVPADVKDIDHYVYDWHADPRTPVDADALGGKAVLFIAPEKAGPQTLYVRSVDRAGNPSPTFEYHTYVRAGSGPVAHWPLNGDPGDTSALGGHDGTLNGATGFTDGADGKALALNGGGDLSAPNAVGTDVSFSVSAWVRIAARPAGDTGVQTAVSENGTVNSGFMLSYRNDPTGDRWEFHLPSADKVARNADTVLRSTGFARPGEWVHLAGVYDVVTNKVSLYVNGEPAGSMVRSEGFDAGGAVELGRAMWEGNAAVNAWNGSIDDVQLFDRALSPSDVQSIVHQADVAVDHFTFDDTASGSTVHNSVADGAPGTLHGGAQLVDHGAVHQALTLGGADDYLSAPNAVRTDSSFSVSAWVRVAARPAGSTDAITALSQDGTSYSGFLLGYRNDPAGDRWEFHLPSADAAQRSADTLLRSSMLARVGVWTHLTGVYDAPTNKVLLYVDGVLAGSTTRLGGFTATGEFKVGRGLWDGNNTVNPWNGAVDEVRAYSRSLTAAEVQGIVSHDNVTVGTWRLDGTLRDDSPRNVAAVPDGTVSYTAGQVSVPDPNDKALALTGTAQSTVSTPHAVDTDQSFSVAAWARVDQLGGNQTVASQDGANVSGFRLRQCGDRWCFVMFPKDVNTSTGAVEAVSSGSAQAGKWTHVVAVYDAAAQKILIYIDGVVAGSAAYTSTWNSGGSFHVGAAGPWLGEFLTGAVDDVMVYSRALTAAEIPALSSRDVSLVHKYTFEEGSGSTSADAAGGRPATLNPGATFTPQGQIGGALDLDGTTGSATTTGVDLRTDQAFTVSAWVYLSSKPCDLSDPANVCKADAVTIDGVNTSKFRLGHLVDGDNHTDGAWVFEMPESDAVDAKVTKAAVSTLSSELDRWTLLTGVYDPAQKQLWISVDGTRVG